MSRCPATQPTATPRDPANPDAAAAFVLELALADPSLTPAKALDMQRQRVAALRDPTSPQALEVLARQLPVLEALWQSFSVQALRARTATDRATLLRVALHAQGAHSRTYALLHTLSGPGQGRGRLNLGDGLE